MPERETQAPMNRREVLRNTAAAGILPLGGFDSFDGTEQHPGHTLDGLAVYRGPRTDLDLPDRAERAQSVRNADVGIVSDNSALDRATRREFLRGDTPLFVNGGTAEDTVVSTLYDVEKSSVSVDTVETETTGFDLSHGIEYEPDSSAYQAALVPDETRGTISTYVFENTLLGPAEGRGDTDTIGRSDLLSNIDSVLQKADRRRRAAAASASVGTLLAMPNEDPDEDGKCPSGWTCLGENQRARDVYLETANGTFRVGSIFKEVVGGTANDDDSDTDYWSWELQHKITPNTNSYFIGTRMWRRFEPYYDRIVRKNGPSNTNTSTSTTIDVGLSADTSGVSGGLGWSWGSTSKEVETHKKFFDTYTGVKNWWDISGDALEQTVNGQPGYQVETVEGESSVTYDYRSEWDFDHIRYAYSKTEVEDGTGDWSV